MIPETLLPARSAVTSRRIFLGTVFAGAAVALVGCAERTVPAPTASASPKATPAAIARYPLTGMPIEGTAPVRPALSAKIGNDQIARPQPGLDHADIIYEEYVEGGLTRYVAVWHSDVPEELGPLRSIRPMDPDILTSFGGIVAYSGGLVPFVQAMRNSGLYNAIHGQADTADLMYRSRSKPAPHNVILRAQQLLAAHTDLAPATEQFRFAREELGESASALSGTPISGVTATFSSIRKQSWAWNAQRGVFERSQQGTPDLDSAGTPRAAINVVGIRVDVQSAYADVPQTLLSGTGEAIVCAGGHSIPATWSKPSPASPLALNAADGSPILLAPGVTWVELIPTGTSAELSTIPA